MKSKSNRNAFTLVELLVVMSLIVILAGFAIAFFPNAASSARESRGAGIVKSTLDIAKMRAMRDQAPRGVRLWIRKPDGGAYSSPPPTWAAGNAYGQFDTVMFLLPPPDLLTAFRCIAPHTSTLANQPVVNGNAFWQKTQLVTEMQYIEQPEDYADGAIDALVVPWNVTNNYPAFSNVTYNGLTYYSRQIVPPNRPQTPDNDIQFWFPNATIVRFSADIGNNYSFVNTYSPLNSQNFNLLPPDSNMKYWHVQPGDYLEIQGGGLMHRVQTVFPLNPTATPPLMPRQLAVTPPLPFTVNSATLNYRIIRAPRVVGDETVKMTEGTLIDLDTNFIFDNPLPQQTNPGSAKNAVDILFAPNGSVISRGVTTPNIHLWVRSPAQDNPNDVFRGEPTIVSVFVRSGLAGAYQPDPNQIVITGLTNQQFTTITAAGGHGLTVGQPITIFGLNGPPGTALNGPLKKWHVTEVPSATMFKIDNGGAPGFYAGAGAIRAPYRLVK